MPHNDETRETKPRERTNRPPAFRKPPPRRRFSLPKRWPFYAALTALVITSLAFTFLLRLYLNRRVVGRPTCAGSFELVIRNGMVLDGLGGAMLHADIGIRDGRIACVGSIGEIPGEHAIDATGMTVAPGFIDVHTHVERNLPDGAQPFQAPNFVRQGVTTIITGNCGASTLAVRKALDHLDRYGSQVNVATFVGHNAVRRRVMQRANRAPARGEMEEMKRLVNGAMDEGALGLSTGLEYVPGTYAKQEEIVELARVTAAKGGLYVSHIRDEGEHGFDAVKEAIDIGEQARLPVHISHFKASGRSQWGMAQRRLDLVDAARKRGRRVSIDQYPYLASSTSLDVLLPSWVLAEESSKVGQRLRDPRMRARVHAEMLAQLRSSGWSNYKFARVAYCPSNLALNGMTIPQITALRGHPAPKANGAPKGSDDRPAEDARSQEKVAAGEDTGGAELQAEVILDLIARGGAQMIYFEMDERDLSTIMSHADTMFGSDSSVRSEDTKAVPHPRGYGTFPRVLARYVREKRTLTLAEAVRRMTSVPARTFGLQERGQIMQGYWADLVIFDAQTIVDHATYEKPLASPTGVSTVIVNGAVVFGKQGLTNAAPGKAIRRTLTPLNTDKP